MLQRLFNNSALLVIFIILGNFPSFAQVIDLSDDQKEAIKTATFTTLEGDEKTLADFEGKVLILDFWETWCTPCRRVMPTLDKLAGEYEDDFEVLAISPGWSDSKEDVEAFKNETGYDFNWLFASELAKELQIQGIPYKVFVSPEGEIIEAMMGIYGTEKDYTSTKEMIEKHAR